MPFSLSLTGNNVLEYGVFLSIKKKLTFIYSYSPATIVISCGKKIEYVVYYRKKGCSIRMKGHIFF